MAEKFDVIVILGVRSAGLLQGSSFPFSRDELGYMFLLLTIAPKTGICLVVKEYLNSFQVVLLACNN